MLNPDGCVATVHYSPIILWYVDQLLGNDHKISNYTRVVAK
jgi:hypothetical protein